MKKQFFINNELNINLVYKEYFDLFYNIAFNFFNRKNNQIDAAKDIAQNTIIKAWKKQNYFNENKANFDTWIFSILKNTMIDYHRSINRNKIFRDDNTEIFNNFISPCLNIDILDLKSNLNKIEEKFSNCLYLNYIEGYTHEQISEKLNEPLGTVKGRIRIGLKKLQKIYC